MKIKTVTGRKSDKIVVHPNIRSNWNVRGGSMFLVCAGALFFGDRSTYLTALAAAIWRENYDCIELCVYVKGGWKIVFQPWMSTLGPQPPLAFFYFLNKFAFYYVYTAAD